MGKFLAIMAALALAGCNRTEQALAKPDAYLPSQQFGNGGATPCMNGACPVINQPKQWLKPC